MACGFSGQHCAYPGCTQIAGSRQRRSLGIMWREVYTACLALKSPITASIGDARQGYTGHVMANVDKHAPGSFSWVELATTDQSAAKTFYTGLFGWAVTDNPMGPNEYYSIFKLKGRDVAAGYTLRKDQRDRGVPVHWSLYIATDNADQTATKATDAGGTILMPPMDVMDAGRMAVIHDPTG